MKKNRILLTALAAALILALSIGSALAYFTDWTLADGTETIHAGHTGEINESFDSWVKHVTVTNTSKDVSVFVRAKVFSTYDVSCVGNNWTPNPAGKNVYIEYGLPLGPGESTPDELNVTITHPTDLEDGDSFNVIVVYEAVPVKYDKDGTPIADWTQEIIPFTEQG